MRGRHRAGCRLAIAFVLTAGCAPLLAQQTPHVYSLSLAGASDATPFSGGGWFALERVRLMSEPRFRHVKLQLAEETFARYARDTASFSTLGSSSGYGDWMHLSSTIARARRVQWSQRVDRLNAAISAQRTQLTVGRQTISWATTLFLTPADPFAPFNPADPFREYRAGVDALRLQFYPDRESEWDFVFRPAKYQGHQTNSALLRVHRTLGAWDLGVWGGTLHDRGAAALQATGTLAGSALRTELELRRRAENHSRAWRGSVGVDRRVTLAQRDLYVVLEYQHDDLGTTNAAALPTVSTSLYARRGELQVLGRDVAAAELTWQAHPLLSSELVTLSNLHDGSFLFAPAVVWSVSSNLSLRAGAYLATGRGFSALGQPGSEFGDVPGSGFLALSAFF